MELEPQKDKSGEGNPLEGEEKIANTLPELAAVSETVKGDEGVKREVGVVLNEEDNEIINTITDKENDNIEKKEQKKSEDDDVDSKINIKVSIEKKVVEFDDSDQIKMIPDTSLSLTGSKEKFVGDIRLDNVSSNSDHKVVENINVDETGIEPIGKIENETIKSLEIEKFTVQNLETDEITSTETAIIEKENTEVSSDQTLIETIVFKGNKDKISKEMYVHSIEVKETFENDIKDQKNIESTTEQEITSEIPADKTTVTTVATDSSTIDKGKSSDSDEKDVVIPQNDSGDKSKDNVVIATVIKEEKPQFEDNDDEDLEIQSPVTPGSEEELLITISKEISELVSDVRRISDKLDPMKRSWNDLNDLKSHKVSEQPVSNHKSEELVEVEREAMIEGAAEEGAGEDEEKKNQVVDQEEGKVPLSGFHVQTLIQPTSSTPSSIVADVMASMVTPGFNYNVVIAMNICFWLLFLSLIFLAVLTDYDQMVLLNLAIAFTLYIALIWFIIFTRADQAREVEEAAKIAKKKD